MLTKFVLTTLCGFFRFFFFVDKNYYNENADDRNCIEDLDGYIRLSKKKHIRIQVKGCTVIFSTRSNGSTSQNVLT